MNAVEDRKLNQACATSKVESLWVSFDKNQRTGVRFGMFPAKPMLNAEKELIATGVPQRDAGRLLTVALMECASRDGGMRA